jgi:hypothetical protein
LSPRLGNRPFSTRYAASIAAASIDAPAAGVPGVMANGLCVLAMAMTAS